MFHARLRDASDFVHMRVIYYAACCRVTDSSHRIFPLHQQMHRPDRCTRPWHKKEDLPFQVLDRLAVTLNSLLWVEELSQIPGAGL